MKVLITGASRGIGAGVARACVAHGHQVGLIARSGDQLDDLVKQLSQADGEAYARVANIGDLTQTTVAIDSLAEELGGIDAVIANAGLSIRTPLMDLDPADWQRMVDANVHGSWNTARASIPHLRRAARGHLVFMSSISGRLPLAPGSSYAATKYAVTGLAESLFHELRDDNISTTVVYPGSVATRLHEDGPDVDQDLMVQPQEIGEAVCTILATTGNTSIHQLEVRPLRKPRRR